MTKYACYICDQNDPCTVNIPDEKMLMLHYCVAYGDEKEARFKVVE